MKYSNDRYNPAFKPKHTFGRDGVLYRSGHEARCANGMNRLDISYRYEEVSFPLPNLPGGYYTPDFIIPDPYSPGGLQVAEASGWLTDKKRAAARSFKSKADDPNDVHKVTSYVHIWTDHIDLHRSGKDFMAGLYKCDDCDSPGYFAPITDDHSCPHCHSEHVTFITKDLNSWDNAQYKEEWEPNWELTKKAIAKEKAEFDAAAGINRKNAQILRDLAAKNTKWDLKDGDEIRFMSITEENGIYVPDFVYYEPFNNRETFGTAFDPLVIVSCESKPTMERENTFDQVKAYILDNSNPLVKHVIFNDKGFFVADNFTQAHYKHGHLYACENNECQKVFPAADGYSTCPCCGSEAHIID